MMEMKTMDGISGQKQSAHTAFPTQASSFVVSAPNGAETLDADVFEDGRVCPVDQEIHRSIQFEARLQGLTPTDVISCDRPRVDGSLISVVVPMFNAAAWIETALRSILIQQANIEVFCVDDASTDDTYDRVRRLFGEDRRVCLARLSKNVGPYQIRNWVASKLARGRWLAFQDADDYSHPNRLLMQQRWLGQRSLVACGACVHQFFPPDLTPARGDTALVTQAGRRHNLVFYIDVPRIIRAQPVRKMLKARTPVLYQRQGTAKTQVPVADSPACYATLMVRRKEFLELGGFEGRTRVGGDMTFVCRLARFYEIANVPAVLYSRRIHHQSQTQRPETGYASQQRQQQFSAFHQKEKRICAALASGDDAEVRALCTSDLYHADVEVADVQTHFAFPV